MTSTMGWKGNKGSRLGTTVNNFKLTVGVSDDFIFIDWDTTMGVTAVTSLPGHSMIVRVWLQWFRTSTAVVSDLTAGVAMFVGCLASRRMRVKGWWRRLEGGEVRVAAEQCLRLGLRTS